MMYEWGHPVATLHSNGGDYTSLNRSGAQTANEAGGHRVDRGSVTAVGRSVCEPTAQSSSHTSLHHT
eukprot:202637-Pleurochrysis_carterae.AAC.1